MLLDRSAYVPVLLAREGERQALKRITPSVRSALTPLLVVPPVPLRWPDGDGPPAAACSVSEHVTKFWRWLGSCPPLFHHRVFLDTLHLDATAGMADGRNALEWLIAVARNVGIDLVPVTSPGRPMEHREAARHAASESGVCLRLESPQISALARGDHDWLLDLVDQMSLQPSRVDLILDLADQVQSLPDQGFDVIAHAAAELPVVENWRSLTVAAAGFPDFISTVQPGSLHYFRRLDWLLHRRLRAADLPRIPRFGDYGAASPKLLRKHPKHIHPSVNLRYTIDNDWLVIRGTPARDDGNRQVQELARAIVDSGYHLGPAFSWGDGWLEECAGGLHDGNSATWRTMSTSHHLAKVTSQLSAVGEL